MRIMRLQGWLSQWLRTSFLPLVRSKPVSIRPSIGAPEIQRYLLLDSKIQNMSPCEATLGSAVEVPTLGGPVEMAIPAGARAGHKLRLLGRGLAPNASDLFTIVQIDILCLISPKEADIYRALASASTFNPQPRSSQEAKHA
jgi:hypothetical protein